MNYMFYNTVVFNQNISGWNVRSVNPKHPIEFSYGSSFTVANSPKLF
jgi:hypothetical protein